jgi:hypothetical protein
MFTSLRTAFRDGHGHRSGRFASRCELLGRPSISSETDGSHGRRQDVGVSSRAHRSIRPREQGSAQGAISRDGNSNPGSAEPLRVATRVGSTAGPVGALVGHQCPVTPSATLGNGTKDRSRSPPLGTGSRQVLRDHPGKKLECHPGEGCRFREDPPQGGSERPPAHSSSSTSVDGG